MPEHEPISHLALVERAELYLIAPATANTLAKLAHGLADNLLTSAALAAACPVAVAPAMNHHMFGHPATRANLELLRARGVSVIEPAEGELASHGEWGVGRLPEPAELVAVCETLLSAPTWAGRRVLVTAGGTREPIDACATSATAPRAGWATRSRPRRGGVGPTSCSWPPTSRSRRLRGRA